MFIYTVLAGLFVQLILLPHIFPAWHTGNGLLKGVDGQQFHRIALELSEKIRLQGWGQWELMPSGQLVSGIAAVCYTLIYPAPWSVLPINALLNASACVVVYIILSNLIRNRQKGLIAALPFMFFPSNMLWNTQFHNENYAIPGVIFIFYGWMLITKGNENNQPATSAEAVRAILSIASGSILLGLVRLYILSGMSYLFIITGIALGIHWLVRKTKIRECFARLTLVAVSCIVMLTVASIILTNTQQTYTERKDNTNENRPSQKWENTTWLPQFIDQKLHELARDRNKFVEARDDAGSSIDLNITFKNVNDMIAYVPRSLQIAFLSPFPNIWFSEGKKPAGSGMRAVAAAEMIFAYFCLLGLPDFIWNNRKQPVLWIITFVCTAMLMIYAMIIPNIGALYRFRYPYFMPLVCFGLAAWIENPHMFRIKKTL